MVSCVYLPQSVKNALKSLNFRWGTTGLIRSNVMKLNRATILLIILELLHMESYHWRSNTQFIQLNRATILLIILELLHMDSYH
jgi:hypothetical protein